jgi:hypothetical protein
VIVINANGIALSPALVLECIFRCQRAGRECTEIWINAREHREYSSEGPVTLGGRPLLAADDHDAHSLLFADSEGTILELHDLATPILAHIFASTLRQGLDTLPAVENSTGKN